MNHGLCAFICIFHY